MDRASPPVTTLRGNCLNHLPQRGRKANGECGGLTLKKPRLFSVHWV